MTRCFCFPMLLARFGFQEFRGVCLKTATPTTQKSGFAQRAEPDFLFWFTRGEVDENAAGEAGEWVQQKAMTAFCHEREARARRGEARIAELNPAAPIRVPVFLPFRQARQGLRIIRVLGAEEFIQIGKI